MEVKLLNGNQWYTVIPGNDVEPMDVELTDVEEPVDVELIDMEEPWMLSSARNRNQWKWNSLIRRCQWMLIRCRRGARK